MSLLTVTGLILVRPRADLADGVLVAGQSWLRSLSRLNLSDVVFQGAIAPVLVPCTEGDPPQAQAGNSFAGAGSFDAEGTAVCSSGAGKRLPVNRPDIPCAPRGSLSEGS
jgi:hypothetical protein